MPCREEQFFICRNNGHNPWDGRLSGNGSSNEPWKNSLAFRPKLSSRRRLLVQHASQQTASPFFLFFFAWLLLMFLPCLILNFQKSNSKTRRYYLEFAICYF